MITKEAWLRDEYDIADLLEEMSEFVSGFDKNEYSKWDIQEYIASLPSEKELAADFHEND